MLGPRSLEAAHPEDHPRGVGAAPAEVLRGPRGRIGSGEGQELRGPLGDGRPEQGEVISSTGQ